MVLGNITIYNKGWTCPRCDNWNEQLAYKCKLGDAVQCSTCRTEFIVNTVTLGKDPALELENKRKRLEIEIGGLVKKFVEETGIIPGISSEVEYSKFNKQIGFNINVEILKEPTNE